MFARLFCILAILLSGTVAQAQPLALEQVADGIYLHRGVHEDLAEGYHGDIANIGFVIGSKGVAVIDTGGSRAIGQQLYQALRAVTSQPVLYVINTHVHPDHIYGNAAFADEKPQFVGHARLANAMARRQEAYARMNESWLGEAFAGSVMIPPTRVVDGTLTLDLGDRQLTLTAFPTAHTDTDITVMDSKTQTLWTGDLLFVERTPSIDGDIKGWIDATRTLAAVHAVVAIPGHGPVVHDLHTALENQARYLTTLLADIRQNIAQDGTMEAAMDSAAASEKSRWVLFDIVNRRNVNTIYPALEWEE